MFSDSNLKQPVAHMSEAICGTSKDPDIASLIRARITARHTFAFSRQPPPEVLQFRSRPQKKRAHATLKRGRGEDRVRAAPAVSCAKRMQKNAHEHTGSAEAVRPSPRNGFTAYFVLSPVTGLFVTVASVMRSIIANLTPASGRQDHTTSPYAICAVRLRAICVHRSPHPTSVTIAIRPSCGHGITGDRPVICLCDQQE